MDSAAFWKTGFLWQGAESRISVGLYLVVTHKWTEDIVEECFLKHISREVAVSAVDHVQICGFYVVRKRLLAWNEADELQRLAEPVGAQRDGEAYLVMSGGRRVNLVVIFY